MLMSPWIHGRFSLPPDGFDVVDKWDMCHPYSKHLPMHPVGSTCPCSNSILAMEVLRWLDDVKPRQEALIPGSISGSFIGPT